MELKDTVKMMNSDDYKERFKAEYYQLKLRFDKLYVMIMEYEEGKLDYELPVPIDTLYCQRDAMSDYLEILERRAEIEGIDI